MAYGQTGAGKTFTMTGATENYKHRGLIPRTISHVFREIGERPQLSYVVRVSYIEIYNEQMVDLLGNLPDALRLDSNLNVVEDRTGTAQVKGLTMKIATSEEEALSYLFEGETTRSIAEHQLNRNSSRSHCVFTIYLESRSRIESSEKVLFSKLNLVDLAGSERLSKTHTTGVSLREAMYINKSLTFLEQVIVALADKRRGHIPYRQSKLTNVLRDALGGNCNTLMISNIRCEADYIEETISTLRFATRMMCVTNTPELNVQYDPIALIKKYEREIKELKQELSMHDTLSNRSHVQHEPFSEPQRLELQRQVKAFLENEEDEIEIVSLRQIREIFHQFRMLYKTQEQENEDWQRIHRNAIGTHPTMAKDDATENINMNTRPLDEKDDGVGELEGTGFGLGLAPSGGRQTGGIAMAAGGTRGPKDRRRKNSRIPGLGLSAQMGAPAHTEVEEEDGKHEIPMERDRIPSPPTKVTEISSPAESSGLPPLPNAHHPNKNNRSLAPPPSRADEFESFKRGKGADINRILNENKFILRDKKKHAKDLAASVNDTKRHIDDLKIKIDCKRHDRTCGVEIQRDDEVVIDEEEYILLNSLKQLKQHYREQYEALRTVRADIEYCSRLVDQCRQKLMAEFEQWYEIQYGGQLPEDGSDGQVEDLMDIGEKFDRLQMERMSQEDPDSLPFYNARKNTERRYHKGPRSKRH
ncbi:hypothetical protein, variant [Spizellomyces punctatus DAOM BR117]|nr:hypothetical protein, variant [Spizellomyces punctatus DAOM BR117]KND02684.1 hypothetical protein, variant [Spizellomyces punctatus DAOM BR117]|eukprot:XP_016610723.1 hypothetical protein, variant [Spizellomyces punctatus DAOM BR117]